MRHLSYSARCALVVDTIRRLRNAGSWCGETHIQKAIYILQDLSEIDTTYRFTIYKHGPFSFELSSELAAMRGAGILELKFLREGYGPSIVPTEFGERVLSANEDEISDLGAAGDFVAKWFAKRDVRELEKVSTAYFVTRNSPGHTVEDRAREINSLKPHVDLGAAEQAVRVVDEKIRDAATRLRARAA